MKIINHDIVSKEKYFDPVKTEQNIQESLFNISSDLPDDLNYVIYLLHKLLTNMVYM